MTDTTDPIDRLGALGDEPVPTEIVLSAVRLFRYRMIALVASVLAAVLLVGLGLAVTRSGGSESEFAAVDASPDAVRMRLGAVGEIDGVRVTMTEYVWADGAGYVRIIAEETVADRAEPEVMVEILGIESPRSAVSSFPASSLSLGGSSGRRIDAAWIGFESPEAPTDFLAAEVLVLPVPQQVVDQGGELSADDGTTAVITYERNN